MTDVSRMTAHEAASLIGEMIPIMHAEGQDHYVEALSEAIDALQWQPLRDAPRDGTWVMVAVSPAPKFNLGGFVSPARWFDAKPTDDNLNKAKRSLAERYGGWWASGRAGAPFELHRRVLAWRPQPIFDFDAHYEPIETAVSI